MKTTRYVVRDSEGLYAFCIDNEIVNFVWSTLYDATLYDNISDAAIVAEHFKAKVFQVNVDIEIDGELLSYGA